MATTKKTSSDLGKRSKSNNIKVDESAPIETFGEGAIRSSKKGKGRYDLLPSSVMKTIITAITTDAVHADKNDPQSVKFLYKFIYANNWPLVISILTSMGYSYSEDEPLIYAFNRMQEDLAKHYENGAEIYGENNWKHGIPKSSFISSGIRHTQQYIEGLTDEPHLISAIWNFCNIIWCDHKTALGIE